MPTQRQKDGFFQQQSQQANNETDSSYQQHAHVHESSNHITSGVVDSQLNHHFISQPTRRRRAGSSSHGNGGHGQKKSPQNNANARIRHRRHWNNNGNNNVNNNDDADPYKTSSSAPQNGINRHISASNGIGHMGEPTFATTLSDLIRIILAQASNSLSNLRQCAPRILRNLAVAIVIAIIIFLTLMVIVVLRFLHLEAIPLCTPPPPLASPASEHKDYSQPNSQLHSQPLRPPLVEYYVHGRGNGHYARSVAIVEQILAKGIDVRMFIGRATMWRAVNAAHKEGISNTNIHFDSIGKDTTSKAPRGQMTVSSVASILPSMSLMDCLSLLIERVMNDCEVAENTNRYPDLVISDGDLPGMLRARMGSIPSVSVAHGQTFVIGQKPSWVNNDAVLSEAWRKQRALNSRTSYFAKWIIATNFVDIPVDGDNGAIARSPVRPEVVRMGNERQVRKEQFRYMDKSGNVVIPQDREGVKNSFMSVGQKDRINQLLLGKNNMEALKMVRNAIETKEIDPLIGSDLRLYRRKLVICYFRDKNGDVLTNALLRSGFDVLLFERGYHKGLSDVDGEKKFGQDLVVLRTPVTHATEIDEDVSLMDHWVDILAQNNRRLLNENENEKEHMEKGKQTGHGEDLNTSDAKVNGEVESGSGSTSEKTLNLQDSVETVLALLNSTIAAPRIIRVTDMSLFVPLLSIADGVASSAGSQLLSECIYSHLNVLALHREDDTEQRLNIAFSKHRFDRLSREGTLGSLKGANMDYYASENVVHGMSLEKFASVFNTISRHEKTKNEYETILTEAEEAMLLRTPDSRQTYEDFKAYVNAVRQSPISWSYYHDLFHGMTASDEQTTDALDRKEENAVDEKERKEYIDPFQGMPEAAGVILEIIEDLAKKASK